MDISIVIFWSLVGSVLSLVGAVALVGFSTRRKSIITYALPFGAGALLGTALLSLIPEAIESGGGEPHNIMPYVVVGFLAFFLLERVAVWLHQHHDHHSHGRDEAKVWRIVLGDTIHNAIDGIAIGVAFLVNIPAGIATALAVAAHEIPQEIGDAGILLSRGMRSRNVILVNMLSSLATVVAAVGVYLLGGADGFPVGPALALAAGFFLYVAASDIIPEIHENPRRLANIQAVLLVVGVVVVAGVVSTLTHSHCDTDGADPHEQHSHHDD